MASRTEMQTGLHNDTTRGARFSRSATRSGRLQGDQRVQLGARALRRGQSLRKRVRDGSSWTGRVRVQPSSTADREVRRREPQHEHRQCHRGQEETATAAAQKGRDHASYHHQGDALTIADNSAPSREAMVLLSLRLVEGLRRGIEASSTTRHLVAGPGHRKPADVESMCVRRLRLAVRRIASGEERVLLSAEGKVVRFCCATRCRALRGSVRSRESNEKSKEVVRISEIVENIYRFGLGRVSLVSQRAVYMNSYLNWPSIYINVNQKGIFALVLATILRRVRGNSGRSPVHQE